MTPAIVRLPEDRQVRFTAADMSSAGRGLFLPIHGRLNGIDDLTKGAEIATGFAMANRLRKFPLKYREAILSIGHNCPTIIRRQDMGHLSRRKAVKTISAGIGAIISTKTIPESWIRPIVEEVVLPAHAQLSEVTQEFAIVACSGESQNGAPPGQAFQTGAEAITNISATVSPIPPAGTMIRLIPTHDDPGQGQYSEQVEPTNALGVADTFIDLGFPNADPFELGTVLTLRFEFDDAAEFGSSFCETSFTVVAAPS